MACPAKSRHNEIMPIESAPQETAKVVQEATKQLDWRPWTKEEFEEVQRLFLKQIAASKRIPELTEEDEPSVIHVQSRISRMLYSIKYSIRDLCIFLLECAQ